MADRREVKPGHRLVSRRDALAHGILPFAAWAALPSLFAGQARADCGGAAGAGAIPFLVFDMAGGAGLPGNFLVGKQGGPEDLLGSYDRLGWDPRAAGALDRSLGLPMAASASQLLAGIKATASAPALAQLRLGSFCHFAQDDSTSNQLNAAALALNAGARGQSVANGLGSTRNASGGNSRSVLEDASLKPTFVSSIDDVIASATFGGPAYASLSIDQLKRMAKAGLDLDTVQAGALTGLPGGQTLAELAHCSYAKSLELTEGAAALDPRGDTNVQSAYGITATTAASDETAVAAAIAANTLKGLAGPSVFTLGGCDYHTGTNVDGDERDGAMGRQIGRAVQLAYLLQKPLFFQLITDGGVDADAGTRNWRGDSGDKSMSVIGYYDPKGAPQYHNGRVQVGYYTDGQAAERSTLVGSQPALAGYAAFANYLAISGKLSQFHDLAPGVFTGAGELESVLIFEGA